MSIGTLAEPSADAASASALYRAVWRWHFYAGLFCLPFMILLAITGALYLYKDELNSLFYADYLHVESRAGSPLTASDIVARALDALPGIAGSYLPPAASDDSVTVGVTSETLGKQRVYVDPYTGAVLGHLSDGGAARTPFMLTLRKIHSLDYFGWVANRVIEMVAGWAVVLVVTGIYLWWPRQRGVGVLKIRPGATRRIWWRDLHAMTGLYVGLVIVFLAATGLPWSGFWGKNVNAYADQAGLGYPPEFWNDVPTSSVPMKVAMTETSWSLENAPMPLSTPTGAAPIGIDRAVAIFDALGVHKGYMIDLPQGEDGVYSASVFPDQVGFERIVHLDQYSGEVLFDGGYKELGAVGKAVEWGISVHMGQQFGLLNQIALTVACAAIVAMAVSGAAMWWQRRPAGRLGAPPLPARPGVLRDVLLLVVPLAVIFPLVGASLIAVLLLDLLVVQRIAPLRRALS
jgi:uncharacterized iron-regulated membrane protein